MRAWLNWRTAIGSIVLASIGTTALVVFAKTEVKLSGLDLFFAITTVISLGFNLWQLFRDRYKYEPLKNALLGLHNDLKGRSLRAHARQLLITSNAGMATPVEALRLEFYDFADETKMTYEELREHVVAAVHTLDSEASSQQVFRASEFGLNAQERQFREEGMERYIERAREAERGRAVVSGGGQAPVAPAAAEAQNGERAV
jgi:hypothetical protein